MHKLFWALALALVAQLGVASVQAATVNVNTATRDELIALPGIGPAKADAIIEYRKANGPFKSVDDVKNVKGIGAKRLEKIRNDLTVGPTPAKVATAASPKPDAKGAAPAAKGEVKGDVKNVAETKPKK